MSNEKDKIAPPTSSAMQSGSSSHERPDLVRWFSYSLTICCAAAMLKFEHLLQSVGFELKYPTINVELAQEEVCSLSYLNHRPRANEWMH
jgi:hypothetical protein